jgi:hypothetical protein
MRLIKNLHFTRDFSRVRVCTAAAPPPSDRTNSERKSLALESWTNQRVETTMASSTLREDHRHIWEALRCEVREYLGPQTVMAAFFLR